MSSQENSDLDGLRDETIKRLAYHAAQLKEVQQRLSKEIRHQKFRLLRKGVAAVNNSVTLWKERQAL